jgi:hypothetical protein
MESKKSWFKLTYRSICRLYYYYGSLIFIGLALTTFFLLNTTKRFIPLSILSSALLAAMGMSLLGCSISYIRKLYKSSINLDISFPTESDEDKIRHQGLVAYFVLRPIFAVGSAILLIVIFKSEISLMAKCNDLSDEFVYISAFFAFFSGYSIGDIIDLFEHKGKEIIKKIFDNPKL